MSNTVYHVANHNVPGFITNKVIRINKRWLVGVVFDRPVGFSGNPLAGLQKEWLCNPDLLFDSSEEAFDAHDPELM